MTAIGRRYFAVLLATAVGPVAGLDVASAQVPSVTPPGVPGAPPLENPPLHVERPAYDPTATGKIVAFWERRVQRNPGGPLDQRELAAAYLARQRESGDIADAVHAEKAARKSLELLPRGNVAALTRLTRALLTQHRFPEALAEARKGAAIAPEFHRLVADIEIELGNYDAAKDALHEIPQEANDLNAKMLQARLDSIHGHPETALQLMEAARDLADESYDTPHEAVAWYHTMIGHTLIDSGKLEAGEGSCRKALEIFPKDYRALTGLAEAATWRRDWPAVIDFAEKSLALAPQNPEALALLGEAQAAKGDASASTATFAKLEALAHSFPRIYDRHWALFCADHDRNLDEALKLVRDDLELRKDVHGYDALAWVCYKKGLQAEAEAAMTTALAQKTQEAPLFFHASKIARAGGDTDRAEALLARARELNPYLVKAAEVVTGR